MTVLVPLLSDLIASQQDEEYARRTGLDDPAHGLSLRGHTIIGAKAAEKLHPGILNVYDSLGLLLRADGRDSPSAATLRKWRSRIEFYYRDLQGPARRSAWVGIPLPVTRATALAMDRAIQKAFLEDIAFRLDCLAFCRHARTSIHHNIRYLKNDIERHYLSIAATPGVRLLDREWQTFAEIMATDSDIGAAGDASMILWWHPEGRWDGALHDFYESIPHRFYAYQRKVNTPLLAFPTLPPRLHAGEGTRIRAALESLRTQMMHDSQPLIRLNSVYCTGILASGQEAVPQYLLLASQLEQALRRMEQADVVWQRLGVYSFSQLCLLLEDIHSNRSRPGWHGSAPGVTRHLRASSHLEHFTLAAGTYAAIEGLKPLVLRFVRALKPFVPPAESMYLHSLAARVDP